MTVELVRDEFTVEEMVELRDETRKAIASHATTLIERVLEASSDPIARSVAGAMQKLITNEHSLCTAIRAQVGG